jgi:uncharacterized protein (TIGR03067 family)
MYTKRLFALALMGMLFCLGTMLQARQDTKPDKEMIKGNWTVAKAEENGKAQDELVKAKFTFKDDKLTLKLAMEKDPVELSYKLDDKKTPKTIDIQPADTKEPAQGIYELTDNGTKLKLCVMDPGGMRPKEFKATTKGVVVIELTRDK